MEEVGKTRPSLGALLINVGTPSAPTEAAVREFLSEFLSDAHVVDLPKWFWWPVLNLIILRRRPRVVAERYKKIWIEAGSPLLVMARRQAELVGERLRERLQLVVHAEVGMQCGSPAIADALARLKDKRCERVVAVPLYPQYAPATGGAAMDSVMTALKRLSWQPEVRVVTGYHNFPAYIEAVVESVSEARRERRGERLLFSFHGLPRRSFRCEDYEKECRITARYVADVLRLKDDEWAVSFQSRFGWEKWSAPYTNDLLEMWAAEGVRSVDVVCPGFAADCLETLEEIAIESQKIFLAAGGREFRYVPALNARPVHVQMLVELICDCVDRLGKAAG